MSAPPTALRAIREQRVLEIRWPDGTVRQLPYRFLRGRCPCAACVDEDTGRRIVDVENIPVGIAIIQAAFSGNYALKITWSDGHDSGLYTWDSLAELCRSEAALNPDRL